MFQQIKNEVESVFQQIRNFQVFQLTLNLLYVVKVVSINSLNINVECILWGNHVKHFQVFQLTKQSVLFSSIKYYQNKLKVSLNSLKFYRLEIVESGF
jgi:hypothetical protein